MPADPKLVSIIVPMHNAQDYIAQTLASLLRETRTAIEVIVVNDRSTDASLARVLEIPDPRIRVVDGPGRGIAACVNAGLAAAEGAVIMRCDADDLYPENRIRRQVAWLAANPEYAAVCGSFSTIDRDGRAVVDLPCGTEPLEITHELRSGVVRTHVNTYALRTELLARIGGFREYFESAEDIDLQLRFGEAGRVGYLPENWYFYRLHACSVTHRLGKTLLEFYHQTAIDFQKQRQRSGLDDVQRGCPPSKPDAGSAYSAAARIQGHLLGRAWREHLAGEKAKALATGLRALTANPSDVRAWKSVVALALKPAGGKP
jgi:glycosyltransferase involved in cell wall biosynthesis